MPLHALNGATGIALVPLPIKVLGDTSELHQQNVGKILRLDFAALFPAQADQGRFIVAHDNAGVRAADEGAALGIFLYPQMRFHSIAHR
jgi:hypothetical protein